MGTGLNLRRILAVAVTAVLLGWGAFSFHSQVSKVSPETGIEWIDSPRGVVADSVIPSRRAWKTGLRPGDHLVAIDGRPIGSALMAQDAPWNVPHDAALVYSVLRDGEPREFSVRPTWVGGGAPVYYYLSIVGLTFLGVGLVVWLRAKRARAATPFALLCQAMFMLLVLPGTGEGTLLDWSAYWGDLAGLLMAPALFLHITFALVDEDRGGGHRLRRSLIYLPPVLLFMLNLYLIPFKNVYRFADPLSAIRFKDRLEELYLAVYLIYGILTVVRAYLSAERLATRWQMKWMALGSLVGFLPAALFYLAPRSLNIRIGGWSDLSVLSISVVPLAFAAAIVRYRLLDLDLFLKKGIVATGLLLSAAATYLACYVVMDRAAGEITPAGLNLALILATFLMAIFYPRLHRRLKASVDQFFYRERYDYRRTLTEFGEAMNRQLSLPVLRTMFTARVERTFGVEKVRVYIRDQDEYAFRTDAPGSVLRLNKRVVERLAAVDYLPLRDHSDILDTDTGAYMIDRLGLEYLLSMTVEGELVAFLGIGTPLGGEPLTSEDLQLLVSLCRHAAVAFQGARLYTAVAEKVREVEALREFNESILESSRVGILVTDPQEHIVAVNSAFESLYGATRDDLVGRPISEIIPERVFESAVSAPRAADAGRPDEGIRVYRTSLTMNDERSLVVNLSRSALRGPDGASRGRVITVDDVTDQVRREEELKHREHLAAIGILASGIAHEVNTPLTGISSYAQILLRERDPNDPEYSLLKKIEQQSFRAAGIASSLLNFSRQRDGDYQNLDVADMMRETLDLFQPHLRGRRVTLDRRIEEPLPQVNGNRGRLQQVLMNLLLNAVDAMPDGGRLTLSACAVEGRVRIEVADTGVGIPAEVLEKIYDPFFTTKPRGHGTGLGLSVSYGIVKEHAGTLTAESSTGEGSRFTISLPAAASGSRSGDRGRSEHRRVTV